MRNSPLKSICHRSLGSVRSNRVKCSRTSEACGVIRPCRCRIAVIVLVAETPSCPRCRSRALILRPHHIGCSSRTCSTSSSTSTSTSTVVRCPLSVAARSADAATGPPEPRRRLRETVPATCNPSHASPRSGNARRTLLRGLAKINKHYQLTVAAHKLGLLMRRLFGTGKPRQFAALRALQLLDSAAAAVLNVISAALGALTKQPRPKTRHPCYRRYSLCVVP